MSTFLRDPNSVLPYTVDWSGWLADFDPPATIVDHVVESDDGIVVEASTHDDTTITVVVSGGTAGQTYRVTFRAILSQGSPYQDDRTIRLVTVER